MSDPLSHPFTISDAGEAIKGLNALLGWYSSQEVYYYNKLWGGTEARWSELDEREWSRYRMEAASIRAGIVALGGKPDDSAYAPSGGGES